MIETFVSQCDNCQRNKSEHVLSPGLLQPLPIPECPWSHIGMDFVEGLPKSSGKDTIMVVVDRLTKYAHFLPLSHPFTSATVATQFMNSVFKLHGMPSSIVSNRDKIFLSHFWKELFFTVGTQLHMSTAYHPQSDGQTERVNQYLEAYLHAMSSSKPTQ